MSLAEALKIEQYRSIVQQAPLNAALNIAIATIVYVTFRNHPPAYAAEIWYLVMVAASVRQFGSWLVLRAFAPSRIRARSMSSARFWAWILGGLWGITVPLFYASSDEALHMFQALYLAGVSAGAYALFATLPFICVRFAVGASAPMVAMFFWSGEPMQTKVALCSILFVSVLHIMGRRNFQHFQDHVRTNHLLNETREDLVDAIESSDDAFAFYKPNGKIGLANARFWQWFPSMQDVGQVTVGQSTIRLADGRWIQSHVRETKKGGFVAIHNDVTELKQRETELMAAKRQAEIANRAKSEFIANMSHELRTPLNAIIGFSEIMKREMMGPISVPQYKDYIGDIHNSGQHLLSLINDILDLSRIEVSKYQIDPEPISVDDLVRWAVGLCQQRPDGSTRPVEIQLSPDLRAIEADLKGIRQMLINLISNALKFTPPDGKVGVRSMLDLDGSPVIAVWDTGLGIPEDKLEQVRRPFQQVESVFHRTHEGVGLGLYITDQIMQLHGGRLHLASALGKGTIVSLHFPRSACVKPAADIKDTNVSDDDLPVRKAAATA